VGALHALLRQTKQVATGPFLLQLGVTCGWGTSICWYWGHTSQFKQFVEMLCTGSKTQRMCCCCCNSLKWPPAHPSLYTHAVQAG
jgi:hypothetical protein